MNDANRTTRNSVHECPHDTNEVESFLMTDSSFQPIDFRSLSDEWWRQRLTPDEYVVLREAGTERPYVGEYVDTKTEGIYNCRACGVELFRSSEKFDSHCGWPSFFDPANSAAVELKEDLSLGMRRMEVICANCKSHLGHVFEGEGYDTPTDLRYCINSISLTLEPGSLE